MRERRIRSRRGGSTSRLVIGVLLLSMGGLMLADSLGFGTTIRLWELWPLLIVALGAIRMLWPGDAEERAGGFWTLVAGLYCWASSWHLFGLRWWTAWPIFLIALGVQIVFEGLFARLSGAKTESSGEPAP